MPAPRIDGSLETGWGDDTAHGARALHRTLNDTIAKAPAPGRPPVSEPPPADDVAQAATGAGGAPFLSVNVRRSFKIAAALALVVAFGVRPLQSLLQATSVEAVLNGRLVTLRAPIEGDVVATPNDFTAWSAIKGAPVLRIRNDHADRTRLDDLRRQVGRLDDERPAVADRLARARDALRVLGGQITAFTQGRIQQLESRCAALENDAAGATARADEARAAYGRYETLAARGFATTADLQRYNRDNIVALRAEQAAKERLQEAKVELDAARNGAFIGDSYNDRPSSAQRADEIRQRIDDIVSDLQARDAQRTRLTEDLADETARFARLSETEVALPVSGRVWEIMVSLGERVRRDQDLIRVLDCSTAVVTANVEESVYNKLRIGDPARFRPSEGGDDISGSIVNLTGMTGVTGNLAIQPQGLQKQGYHVTMSVPAIARSGACSIGRTGRVFFDKADSNPAPAQLDFGLRR